MSPTKEQILLYVNLMQEQGKTISTRLVSVFAKRYDKGLRRMNRYTVFAIVRCFLVASGRVSRAITHQSQADPKKKVDTTMALLEATRQLIQQQNRQKRFIINMDQTPYDPHDSPKRTYTKKGAKTVTGKDMNTSVGRVTVCLAVCADGHKLPPMVVFKGQPDKYKWRETRQYPKDALYQVQKNAWCDATCMLYWVENILKPFV